MKFVNHNIEETFFIKVAFLTILLQFFYPQSITQSVNSEYLSAQDSKSDLKISRTCGSLGETIFEHI